jgi:hypothetical protein
MNLSKIENHSTLLYEKFKRFCEIEMQICCFKFEAMEGGVKRYRFKLADCGAIVDEFDAMDWCSLFSGRRVVRELILREGLELL